MTTKTEMLKMVRLFCSECLGGPRASEHVWPVSNIADIENCSAPECIWYEYRSGKDPRPRKQSKKQRDVLEKARQSSLAARMK